MSCLLATFPGDYGRRTIQQTNKKTFIPAHTGAWLGYLYRRCACTRSERVIVPKCHFLSIVDNTLLTGWSRYHWRANQMPCYNLLLFSLVKVQHVNSSKTSTIGRRILSIIAKKVIISRKYPVYKGQWCAYWQNYLVNMPSTITVDSIVLSPASAFLDICA